MQGRWVATAESVTGGQLGATITAIPGASKIYRGGVISYATDLKASLLGVSTSLLAEGGAVQAQVALEMATGVAEKLNAEFGLAVTGVAGPDSQDGHLP
ncbi:MAG: nicotinamide-nucleotide amidohydrolase family protein, partial [Actinobacteria bacterium]|nr:nicotinamide-nucleotide amidohydrolase family protein [Actinomycetota bacterium]